jgi:hypothetical protein
VTDVGVIQMARDVRREVIVQRWSRIALLSIALLAVTGCANVSLQQYYARVPSGAKLDVDPSGGYMLLY